MACPRIWSRDKPHSRFLQWGTASQRLTRTPSLPNPEESIVALGKHAVHSWYYGIIRLFSTAYAMPLRAAHSKQARVRLVAPPERMLYANSPIRRAVLDPRGYKCNLQL